MADIPPRDFDAGLDDAVTSLEAQWAREDALDRHLVRVTLLFLLVLSVAALVLYFIAS